MVEGGFIIVYCPFRQVPSFTISDEVLCRMKHSGILGFLVGRDFKDPATGLFHIKGVQALANTDPVVLAINPDRARAFHVLRVWGVLGTVAYGAIGVAKVRAIGASGQVATVRA